MKDIDQKIQDAVMQGSVPITKDQLSLRVEWLVRNEGMRYLESICHVADELDVEPSDMTKIISVPLLSKIKAEAQSLNNIPRTNTSTLF